MRDADLAQLAEHVISNDEVEGSNPLVSICLSPNRKVRIFLLEKSLYHLYVIDFMYKLITLS